jgi:hypothetical protein
MIRKSKYLLKTLNQFQKFHMNKKKRIVVIGTGWAGARVARDLNLD